MWSSLLSGGNKKLPPPVKSTPTDVPPTSAAAEAAPPPPPPPGNKPFQRRSPSPNRSSTPSRSSSPIRSQSPIRSLSPSRASKASGFSPPKMPPSPRSLGKTKENALSNVASAPTQNTPSTPPPAGAVLTVTDQNKPEQQQSAKETWVPPLSPPSSPQRASSNAWSINEKSSPSEQPIASSPVKAGRFGKPISNLDKTEVRLKFANEFVEGINKIEEERQKDLSLRYIIPQIQESQRGRIRVFVRKRPLLPKERQEGDFDVVRVESDKSLSAGSVVVYNTLFDTSSQTQIVKPAIYGAEACFDESSDSGEIVYQKCTKALVETAKSGGIATLLLFGQSGSGKSFTMSAMEGMAARDIFTRLPYNHTVKVTVVELGGQECVDLLDESASPVRVADNNDGSVKFVNALQITVNAPEDLLEKIINARRKSKPVGRDGFCRHTVCRIVVVPPKDAPRHIRAGSLTLVLSAGAERGNKNQSGSSDGLFDRARVNASLWALKESLRAKSACGTSSTNQVPYNYSTLTRILRESLEREGASFHVIATVSPKATDTEETIDTLSTVSHLIGGYSEIDSAPSLSSSASSDDVPTPPKGWDNAELCDWLTRKHLVKDLDCVPSDITGRNVMKMTKAELQKVFFGDDFQKADLLYRCLRAESDRVARLEVKRRMAAEIAQRGK